jgi:NitT/TauT family transport system ATP-binding protein
MKEFPTRRGPVRALDDVSFAVREGTFLAIVGPSGCGKTTLLRILAGLEEASTGRVVVNSGDAKKPLNSMVFQEQSVLPWLTVRDNIGYGLYLRRVKAAERNRIVDHYLRVVGLTRFADSYPHQLSGGMKQRVSVARAFANDPEILLMDEPFAALDEQNKILLQQELLRLWEGSNKTVIYITHSIDEALNLSDRIMVMTAHPGKVKAFIDVDLPRPRNVVELRGNPRFQLLFASVWGLLREEVAKAKRSEGLELELI